jgi:predicted transcriptional regulator
LDLNATTNGSTDVKLVHVLPITYVICDDTNVWRQRHIICIGHPTALLEELFLELIELECVDERIDATVEKYHDYREMIECSIEVYLHSTVIHREYHLVWRPT